MYLRNSTELSLQAVIPIRTRNIRSVINCKVFVFMVLGVEKMVTCFKFEVSGKKVQRKFLIKQEAKRECQSVKLIVYNGF